MEPLANLIVDSKCEFVVGVAGSTLIEECGDRPALLLPGLWRCSMLFDDVEEALLCVWYRGILLTEETEEEVDFRPRRPPEPLP